MIYKNNTSLHANTDTTYAKRNTNQKEYVIVMSVISKQQKQSEKEYFMKKRWITILSAALFVMLIMTAAETKAASKTGAWDKGKKEVQTKGAFTYYTHPSKNGKEV